MRTVFCSLEAGNAETVTTEPLSAAGRFTFEIGADGKIDLGVRSTTEGILNKQETAISEDIKVLTGIPGIGPKSAKRIILELKDKIKQQQQIEEINSKVKEENNKTSKIQEAIKNNDKVNEAISALQVLGYNKKEIEKKLEKLDIKEMTLEEIIKKGLLELSK